MAANYNRLRYSGNGQTRRAEYHGIATFSTTDTTVELDVPSEIKRIEAVLLTPLGAFDADDQLSVNETVVGSGGDKHIARPAGGTITVTRNSSGTSALNVAFLIIGQ